MRKNHLSPRLSGDRSRSRTMAFLCYVRILLVSGLFLDGNSSTISTTCADNLRSKQGGALNLDMQYKETWSVHNGKYAPADPGVIMSSDRNHAHIPEKATGGPAENATGGPDRGFNISPMYVDVCLETWKEMLPTVGGTATNRTRGDAIFSRFLLSDDFSEIHVPSDSVWRVNPPPSFKRGVGVRRTPLRGVRGTPPSGTQIGTSPPLQWGS